MISNNEKRENTSNQEKKSSESGFLMHNPSSKGSDLIKKASDSRCYLAEIVGEESLSGQRMQAGALLDLMDLLAGRVAYQHAQTAVATVAFSHVNLEKPVMHQDLVRLEGELARVGSSSMIVFIRVFRQDILSREFIPIQNSCVTMVAIDPQGKPFRHIPQLAEAENDQEKHIREKAELLRKVDEEWSRLIAQVDQEKETTTSLSVQDLVNDENQKKQEFLRPDQTKIEVKRQFLPRNVNHSQTIFGGDILHWMDRVATHTARHFTRNMNNVVVSMNRIFFKKPIYHTDLVEMRSQVIYVGQSHLVIEIGVFIERSNGNIVPSHSGYFTIQNLDTAGFARPILTGLKLSDEDQKALKAYRKAKLTLDYWKSHSDQLQLI
eukprot:gb/GECH01003183.1/.p1 GENE.gb/GECH01003183.1/~~gb/GECH01003183.1/.p1  ORF type:complete len:379 (+),score=119.71 gb/GECH01003183.1/:1-1137(+)